MYWQGKGVPKNYVTAAQYLNRAIGYNDGRWQKWYEVSNKARPLVPALIALVRAADQGVKGADDLLARACARTYVPSTKTYEEPIPACAEAAATLEKKARTGTSKDKLLLSKMYRFGWIVLRDDAKADEWETTAGGSHAASTGNNLDEESVYRAFYMRQLTTHLPPTEADIPGLLRMLNDKSRIIQYVAAGKFKVLQAPDEAGPLLYAILNRSLGHHYQTSDYHGRRSAAMALAHMGAKGIPWLTQALKTSDPPGQEEAAAALGSMGQAAASAISALEEWGKGSPEHANLSAEMIKAIQTNGQSLQD
jgi:hypothetical protein